jgi:hypothetical protein
MKKTNVIVGVLFLSVGFTALSQKKGTGLTRDDAGYKAIPMIEKPLGFGENLPSSYSLKDYIPAQIGDQGSMGTCTGWSSTYYLSSMEFAIKNNIKDQSIINALTYDPYYTYNAVLTENNQSLEGCQDGTGLDEIADWLIKKDVKRMNIDPSSCGSTNSSFNGSLLDFTDYSRLFDYNSNYDDQISSVCQSLVNNHPVFVGMFFPDTFFDVTSDGEFNSGGEAINWDNGHALCVVGYDDNKLGGCFTVVNSWGQSWGDNGLVYIKYRDFFNYVVYGISFETEVKQISNSSAGCTTGDCNSGYGVSVLKKKTTGYFEGYFVDGKPNEGIYTVYSGMPTKRDTKLMKKLMKKNSGQAIYSNSTMVGVIID